MINYYQVLDIQDFAPAEEVKRAYRAKCKQYHPDLVSNLGVKLKLLARREMAKVNFAYQELSSPEAQARYDEWLRATRRSGELKTCIVCGVGFTPDGADTGASICPSCAETSQTTESPEPEEKSVRKDPVELLRTCFTVLHHFTTSSVLKKFAPSVNIIVSGSRMKVYGPPGELKIVLDNKSLYDLVQPGGGVTRHPWSNASRLGKISIDVTHPVEAAAALWEFCRGTLGLPEIQYCRVAINNDDYTAYEASLSQSVLMAISGVSPWTAARLYSRHNRNLSAAIEDPDATPDTFLNIIARPLIEQKDAELETLRSERASLREEIERKNHGGQDAAPAAVRPGEPAEPEMETLRLECMSLRNELENVRREALSREAESEDRNSTIAELLAYIEEIWQSVFVLFDRYSEFSSGVPVEDIRVQDVGILLDNMSREIQSLRKQLPPEQPQRARAAKKAGGDNVVIFPGKDS